MSPEFTEADYIKSFEYQYRVDGDQNRLPEGYKPLIRLAELNGKLLWRQFEPLEPKEWQKIAPEIREATATEQIAYLAEHDQLKRLRLVTVEHTVRVLEKTLEAIFI